MKNWFTILLLLPFLLSSKTSSKTEVIIFGTVHEARGNFDEEDMLKILEQVKPDVILFEHPISWDAEEFSEFVTKIKNPTFETIMVKKYLDRNPSLILKYYDIENRNKYYIETRYFEQEEAFNKKLEDLFNKSELNDSLSLFKEQISMLINFDKLCDFLDCPRAINSAAADSICAMKHRIFHTNFLKYTETVPELKQFKEFIISKQEYWDKRNKTMTKNIINYATEFQGKRIIVTTGFEHRYYLRNELEKSSQQNFVLKEYWEYE